jgi:hypothetical protein
MFGDFESGGRVPAAEFVSGWVTDMKKRGTELHFRLSGIAKHPATG